MNEKLKKILPHAAAIILFIGLSVIYFYPVMFEDKDLYQSDLQNMAGWGKDLRDYHKETGEYAFWSNSMFSGMPANYTFMPSHTNIFRPVSKIFRLNLSDAHVGVLFVYLFGFYIFLITLGCKPLLSIIGSIAYAFASYNLIILEAGHINKGLVMATMAPVLGGVILCYRKKYLSGGFITLIFTGINVVWSHQQISYYLLLMILILTVVYFIYAIKKKSIKEFFISSAVLLAAAASGIAPSAGTLLSTMDYTKDTMRGGSELKKTGTAEKENSGLDIEYAYAWSYGKSETMTLLIPNFNGASSHYNIGENSELYRFLRPTGQAKQIVKNAQMYWGGKPFTSGPNYAGAIVCLLFIMGLIIVKGPEKWWLLGATLLSFILAWGKNFSVINDFLFYHLPLYNKFRTPEMALVIAGVTMTTLAILALKQMLDKKENRRQYLNPLYISAGITGGLCLIFALFGGILMGFTGEADRQLDPDMLAAIVSDRKNMLAGDAWRSLIFILAAAAMLWYYTTGKLKTVYLISVTGALILVDLWTVDRRFLGEDDFFPRKRNNTIVATEANKQIMQDKDPDYRVFNLATNTFNESRTSCFHKSIGGYSPAKLQRYQDIIDYYLGNREVMNKTVSEIITAKGDFRNIDANAFPVINMLNTKYLILPAQNGATVPLQNPYALGNAWFVDEIKWVDTPLQEIEALKTFHPAQTAYIDRQWQDKLPNWQTLQHEKDSTATIRLTAYVNPGNLIYESNSSKPSLAVFSEIYYKTWKAFVDGREAPLIRVNYILRAMEIPAGTHKIEFKCIDGIFLRCEKISVASSWITGILILCVLGFRIWKEIRNVYKK
ncbi:MAG: hypothetical protein LBD80_03710 [Tannerella sp.]|jgi:hypothetical protein|nr:hypothetical protein [Tannerella sp.]